ncbi:MAG TPA: hypothetical protein VNC50_03185, partial [Planctomycetia bacterium]|nr:hypothetical protein [Planctomycetia bacterium]
CMPMRMVADVEAPPIRAENPDVPLWLEGIVRKLHAKDPAARFQSAAEVAELLERCLAHVQQPDRNPLPPAAAELGRQVGAVESSPRRSKLRRRIAATIAGAGLVAAIAHYGYFQPHGASETNNDANVAAANHPEVELDPWDPAVDETVDLRRKFVLATELFGASQPPPAPDSRFLRQHLQSLAARFLGLGEEHPAVDPLAEQVESLRRRIERLEREFDPPRP